MNGQINFGSGRLFLHDGTNAVEVGVLKDVSVDFSSTQKELRGNRTYAIAIATSGQKISGKATSGVFSGKLIASIIGGTAAAGSKRVQSDSKTAAASVTVTPPSSGVWYKDLGVEDANGVPMKYNAVTPSIGEYKVAAGVYTFNAGQTGTLAITYSYTLASTGNTLAINNGIQAAPTTYEIHLDENYGGQNFGLRLFACVVPKVSFGAKAEDFTETAVEFEAVSTATNTVGELYFA